MLCHVKFTAESVILRYQRNFNKQHLAFSAVGPSTKHLYLNLYIKYGAVDDHFH